jgi:hypothetical protein
LRPHDDGAEADLASEKPFARCLDAAAVMQNRSVRSGNGHYECTQCGQVIDVPVDRTPVVIVASASGEAIVRRIVVDGQEIHECQIGRKPVPPPRGMSGNDPASG